jgi:thiamine pyrophosphokinase
MRRCVIVGGAPIENYSFIKGHFGKDDFFVFCDSGLKHISAFGVAPNLIIGDFDSHEKPETSIETIVLPCEKDDTDTVFAVKEALKRGFDEFLLVGVIGKRFDHSFGNISILLMLQNKNKKAVIIDDFSEMEIVSSETVFIDDDCKFFSLLNISGQAKEIDIKNAKYELSNSEIKSDYQYGISNEVIKGKTAEVKVGVGKLLLIKVFHE